MSRRRPRWERVRTDSGWHVRFRSSNGRLILSSEVYRRERDAINAIYLATGFEPYWVQGDMFVTSYTARNRSLEVRYVDERTAKP